MRVLIDRIADRSGDLEVGDLPAVYAAPRLPWLRANMVQTLDGAATGADGVTGSINNAADKLVFETLRSLADVILVGAGTARTEGYRPTSVPTVLVSRRGEVPERLRGAAYGAVVMVTCAEAPALGETTALLGNENVVVLGQDAVDLPSVRGALEARGHRSILCEGGPQLLTTLLEAGAVDELCATLVPALVGGTHPRITLGPDIDRAVELVVLIEESGTLLGRWLT
jgi:riboflavin biosynthesis pyrimidine reductase